MIQARITFEDGSVVSGRPDSVAAFAAIVADRERDTAAWVADLRARGVKAAHPYDGWVDRTGCRVLFAYPYFDDGVTVGDRVVLGWPPSTGVAAQETPVVITGESTTMFRLHWWHFKYVLAMPDATRGR